MLLKNQWVNEEIKEEIKKYLETDDNENSTMQNLGCSKSRSYMEVHRNIGFPQKMRKISNKQPNLPTYHLKELEREEQHLKSAEERK